MRRRFIGVAAGFGLIALSAVGHAQYPVVVQQGIVGPGYNYNAYNDDYYNSYGGPAMSYNPYGGASYQSPYDIGTMAPGVAAYPYYQQGGNGNMAQPAFLPRTSDSIEAHFLHSTGTAARKLSVAWRGDTRTVAFMRFTLLDKNGKPLVTELRTKPPASAQFAITKSAASYQVVVTYMNGATITVSSPI